MQAGRFDVTSRDRKQSQTEPRFGLVPQQVVLFRECEPHLLDLAQTIRGPVSACGLGPVRQGLRLGLRLTASSRILQHLAPGSVERCAGGDRVFGAGALHDTIGLVGTGGPQQRRHEKRDER